MGELREALLKGREAAIEAAQVRVDQLFREEPPGLDDAVRVTPSAKRRVPELVNALTPRQVARFIAFQGDQLPDPVDLIVATVEQGRKLGPAPWAELRGSVAAEVGFLVAGYDEAKAGEVAKSVTQLLQRGHGLKTAEFAGFRPEMEKRILGHFREVGPLEVIRHLLEREIAELLANPRLPEALQARLAAMP